jgi:hypothetical protein
MMEVRLLSPLRLPDFAIPATLFIFCVGMRPVMVWQEETQSGYLCVGGAGSRDSVENHGRPSSLLVHGFMELFCRE